MSAAVVLIGVTAVVVLLGGQAPWVTAPVAVLCSLLANHFDRHATAGAHAVVRWACRPLPQTNRDDQRDEWDDHLAEGGEEGVALLIDALRIVRGAPLLIVLAWSRIWIDHAFPVEDAWTCSDDSDTITRTFVRHLPRQRILIRYYALTPTPTGIELDLRTIANGGWTFKLASRLSWGEADGTLQSSFQQIASNDDLPPFLQPPAWVRTADLNVLEAVLAAARHEERRA